MILVDTSVIIDFWKTADEQTKDIFLNEDVAICGVIVAELVHGAQHIEDIDRILLALSPFTYIRTEEHIWTELGSLLFRLKKSGITVPFQDALMAALAMHGGLMVWSKDKHFKMIQDVIPEIKLFTPSQ